MASFYSHETHEKRGSGFKGSGLKKTRQIITNGSCLYLDIILFNSMGYEPRLTWILRPWTLNPKTLNLLKRFTCENTIYFHRSLFALCYYSASCLPMRLFSKKRMSRLLEQRAKWSSGWNWRICAFSRMRAIPGIPVWRTSIPLFRITRRPLSIFLPPQFCPYLPI